MKLLFDTNAFNYYIASLTGEIEVIPRQVNIQGLVELVRRHQQQRDLLLHSTSVYELFIKCIKENFSKQALLLEHNKVLVTRFVDEFNRIKDQRFRLINEQGDCRFDLEILDQHFNKDGNYITASTIIDKKINYELKMIERFFGFIILICSEVLFDKYEDIVDVHLFDMFILSFFAFSREKIKEILDGYYYTKERKEAGVKSLDYLLHYIVLSFETTIRTQSSNAKTPEEVIDFLTKSYITWGNNNNVGEGKGAEYVNRMVCENNASSKVKKLINQKVSELNEQLKKMGKPALPTEQKYMIHLLEKVILNKYKIAKNDFTDCLLLSACDGIPSIPEMNLDAEIVVVTFDARLKTYMETNNIYYSKEIYDQIYQ